MLSLVVVFVLPSRDTLNSSNNNISYFTYY